MSRRQWLLAAAGMMVGSGCAASQKLSPAYLTGNRTILIAPAESPPIVVPSASEIVYGDGSAGGGGFVLVIAATAALAQLPKAKETREAAMLDLGRWSGAKTWQSGAVLAEVLARKLSAGGRWRTKVRPVHSDLGAAWRRPGYYEHACSAPPRRSGALVTAAEARQQAAGLVLELDVSHTLTESTTLTLNVSFRLADPATGADAGRGYAFRRNSLLPPLTELFDNNGAAFRAAFLKLGNQCLDECLAQTGLMA